AQSDADFVEVGIFQHDFLRRLPDEQPGVACIVFRFNLTGRKSRINGLRWVQDIVEKLHAAVFLADATEVRTELTAAVAETVALNTLHAAFGEKHLLAAGRVALEREDTVGLGVSAKPLDTPFLGNES